MSRTHELNFVISAALNGGFQTTMNSANAEMAHFAEQYRAVAGTLGDVAGYQRQQQAIENTKAKLEKQLDALDKYREKLKEAGIDTGALDQQSAKLRAELDALGNGYDQTGDAAVLFSEKTVESADEVGKALAAAGIIALLKKIEEGFKNDAEAARAFEATMAGVRRTVGGSEEEIAAMGEDFKALSENIPITTEKLGAIATTAGQLGIAQENVEGFTKVMAMLDTTTDLTSEDAAEMLAQFSNITGTKDYERLGSVVAALGDETATTASRVVKMAQGLAASASVAGMSETDILAIAAAVGALGIEANAGSSSMSQIINKLNTAVETGDKLEDFAAVAGMSAAQFKTAWGRDAVGALNSFISGLNDTERNGASAIVMLNELGVTNVRQTKAVMALANAGDLLGNTIAKANTAWEENTALGDKAEIMYDTTEAKLTMLQNRANNMKIAIGDGINPLLSTLYGILGNVLSVGAEVAETSPALVQTFTAAAIAAGGATAALGLYTAAAKIAKVATDMLAGPIGWLDIAATAFIATMAAFALTAGDATDQLHEMDLAVKNTGEVIETANANYRQTADSTAAAAHEASIYVTRLEQLETAGLNTSEAHAEYAAIVDNLNALIPDLNLALDEETGLVNGGTDAIRAQTDAWKENALAQAFQTAYAEQMQAWADLQVEVFTREKELSNAKTEGLKITNDIAVAYARLSGLQERRAGLTADDAASTEDLADKQAILDGQIAAEQEHIAELNVALTDNQTRQEDLRTAITEGKTASEEFSAQIDEAMSSMKGYSEGAQEAAEDTDAITEAIGPVLDELQLLAAGYKEAYDAAEKNIEKQFDLWDQADTVVATSVTDINNALQSQIGYWQSYGENIEELKNRNIAGITEMVSSLADGSTESAAYIAGLAALSNPELESIVAQWQALKEEQSTVKEDIAEVQTGFSDDAAQMADDTAAMVADMNLSTEARSAAIDTLNAYIGGANGMLPSVARAYQLVAHTAVSQLQNGMSNWNTGSTTQGTSAGTIYITPNHNATGTNSAEPGWSWVGEDGPELVFLRGGEAITDAKKSAMLAQSAGGITIAPQYHITGSTNAAEVRRVLEEHDRDLENLVRRVIRTDASNKARGVYA